jgi:hypothetical protein
MIVRIHTPVRFGNLTAVLLKIRVLWDVKPTHFSEDSCIFIFGVKQCKKSDCLTLKVKALRSSETSAAICPSTRHSILEGVSLYKQTSCQTEGFLFLLRWDCFFDEIVGGTQGVDRRVKWSESLRKGSVLRLMNVACHFAGRLACRQAAQRSLLFSLPVLVLHALQSMNCN